MAEPHDFPGANVHAAPPRGFEEMIGWLHCFHNGRCAVSAWKPSPEELADLNKGGSIFVSVMSGAYSDGRPIILPMFVGSEDQVRPVVRDTGLDW